MALDAATASVLVEKGIIRPAGDRCWIDMEPGRPPADGAGFTAIGPIRFVAPADWPAKTALLRGAARPVLRFGEAKDLLPPSASGRSIGQLYRDYVGMYGAIPALLQRLGEALPRRIEARHCRALPEWRGHNQWRPDSLVAKLIQLNTGASGARPAGVYNHEEIDRDLAEALLSLWLRAAVHRFLRFLQGGTLAAEGIAERQLEFGDLQPVRIHADWWGRDIAIDMESSELHERDGTRGRRWLRRWSGICARRFEAPTGDDEDITTAVFRTVVRILEKDKVICKQTGKKLIINSELLLAVQKEHPRASKHKVAAAKQQAVTIKGLEKYKQGGQNRIF